MRKQVKCYKKLVAMITGLFAIQVSIYDGGLGAVPRAARISPWQGAMGGEPAWQMDTVVILGSCSLGLGRQKQRLAVKYCQ